MCTLTGTTVEYSNAAKKRIAELEAENADLRRALERIERYYVEWPSENHTLEMYRIAAEALNAI